ncbi:hypothetical protein YC2023_031185 [Brassica napus]
MFLLHWPLKRTKPLDIIRLTNNTPNQIKYVVRFGFTFKNIAFKASFNSMCIVA